MSENKFIDGLFARDPHQNAPDFVKGRLSIKPQQFNDWLQAYLDEEWINIDIKESKEGKWYCAINDYKPEKTQGMEEARKKLKGENISLDDIAF